MKAGRRVVALVDDDPLFRVPIAQGLDAAGYLVIGAATGTEAVDLLCDREVDVALVDIQLVGRLDGIGAVREAKRLNPALEVIFTSGRPPGEDVAPLGSFLPKPFRMVDLLTRIENCLAAARRAQVL